MIVGKCYVATGASASINQGGCDVSVMAAKPYKSIYCVDNVDMSVDADKLTSFVSSLGVRVLSCYEVKPRMSVRQRLRGITPDHRTFRLCINRADNNTLLQAESWPSDVSIYRWIFKPTSVPGANITDPTPKENSSLAVSHADNAQAIDVDDMDATIILDPLVTDRPTT